MLEVPSPSLERTLLKMRFALCALLSLTACRAEPLSGLVSSLRFELEEPTPMARALLPGDPVLIFPGVYAQTPSRTLTASIVNEGRVPLDVTWSGLVAPFSSELPSRLEPGATPLTIRCDALTPGISSAVLEVLSQSGPTARLGLEASAWPVPSCSPSGGCVAATFDVTYGRCVERPLADGTACESGTLCVESSTCQAGRCAGEPKSCDDGNACTVDVCHALTGCEHLPTPPCPGDGICQVGVCRPDTGCALAPAADGTRCGPQQTCVAAEICIAGACVVRDPPDGYVCEEASPCTDQGRCVAEVCVHQLPPDTLASSWSVDSLMSGDADAGVPPVQLHDFVLEPSGAMTVSGFFNTPAVLRANTPVPVPAPFGVSRRCILWNERLVCADYPASPYGRVTGVDLATGATQWTFDIAASRPAYLERASPLFLARLVAMGSDRLAAVYEGYPVPAPSSNNLCRTYFLVVMDARGRLVTAQPISDPLLDVCNHPHPYGAAADAQGNLFIAFSPTANNGTPLLPDRPTLLVSYTRDGVFRWKVLDESFHGGELAVARGLLYPENSPMVLSAATGTRAFGLDQPLGRAVISESRMIPAPLDGHSTLSGYEAGLFVRRWTHTLPAGFGFWGEQIRLARWDTSNGFKTVALSFITDAASRRLHAVDVLNGQTAFSCELQMPSRTVPQLFEVADEHLAVMHGALDGSENPSCGKCDPPFAGASAAFQSFDLEGLFTSPDPWPGTFGGPMHDHHEKTRAPGN